MTVSITTELLAEEGVTCPQCHGKLIVRHPREGQKWRAFAGCAKYPACRGTRELVECGYMIVGAEPSTPYDMDPEH